MDVQKKPLSTAEQMLRWIGLAAVIAAIALAVTRVEGTRPLSLLLLLGGLGCYIAMAVLASQRKKAG